MQSLAPHAPKLHRLRRPGSVGSARPSARRFCCAAPWCTSRRASARSARSPSSSSARIRSVGTACTAAPLHRCTAAPLHSCPPARLHACSTALLHRCTAATAQASRPPASSRSSRSQPCRGAPSRSTAWSPTPSPSAARLTRTLTRTLTLTLALTLALSLGLALGLTLTLTSTASPSSCSPRRWASRRGSASPPWPRAPSAWCRTPCCSGC